MDDNQRLIGQGKKKIQQKTKTNPLSVLRQATRGVTPDIAVNARRVGKCTAYCNGIGIRMVTLVGDWRVASILSFPC